MKQRIYRFPANQRAQAATLSDQLLKVIEEAREVLQAYENNEGDERIIEELWDSIQADEGALRKFPLSKVIKGFILVKLKSNKRGDYLTVRGK